MLRAWAHLVVEAGLAELFDEDGIGFAQQVCVFALHFAEDANAKARARERMAVDHFCGEAKLDAEFAHVVLEVLERGELARPDDDVVAQQAHLRAAAHEALEHAAARDVADLRHADDLADFEEADLRFAQLRREQARKRSLHVVDGSVNDVVVADVDAFVFGKLSRLRIRADVEADDDALRSGREVHVRLRNAAHGRMHDVAAHFFVRELRERVDERFLRALDVGLHDEG